MRVGLVVAVLLLGGCDQLFGFKNPTRVDGGAGLNVDGAADSRRAVDASSDATLPACGSNTDYNTDSHNCGACGYGVIGARTCVNGKPTPGWVAIASPPTPFSFQDYAFAAWTGLHVLVVKMDNTQLEYEPGSDSWTTLDSNASLVAPIDSSGTQPIVTVPSMRHVYVWGNNKSGVALQIFTDGPTPSWSTAPLAGTAPLTRVQPALAYSNGYVYAFFNTGSDEDGGDRYDVNAMAWEHISPDPAFGDVSLTYNGRDEGPLAPLGSNLVTYGGGTNGGDEADPKVHVLNTGTLTWGSAFENGELSVNDNVLVASQGRVLAFGGRDTYVSGCLTTETLLIDPVGMTASIVAAPPLPSGGMEQSYAFDLGNAVMIWGGYSLSCDSGTSAVYAGGSLGVIDTGSNTVDWTALPADTFEPATQPGMETTYQGNTQNLWTGREAIVWGGQEVPNGSAANNVSGSRYQPPVGCVCPSSQPICASISAPGSGYAACDPTGQ